MLLVYSKEIAYKIKIKIKIWRLLDEKNNLIFRLKLPSDIQFRINNPIEILRKNSENEKLIQINIRFSKYILL